MKIDQDLKYYKTNFFSKNKQTKIKLTIKTLKYPEKYKKLLLWRDSIHCILAQRRKAKRSSWPFLDSWYRDAFRGLALNVDSDHNNQINQFQIAVNGLHLQVLPQK